MPEKDKQLITSYCASVEGENYEKDSRLFSQLWFNAPHIRLAEEQTKGGGKSYTYYFTPEASVPYLKCGHATELAVVFNHPEETAFTGRVFDQTFSRTMRRMWVQFAKTGNPSDAWPLYNLKDKWVMVFDEFNIHPEKESAIKVVDWERTYPLTKYYYL